MPKLGYRQSAEHRMKNSLWHKGKQSRLGSFQTDETKRKIGLKSIGRIKSIECRKKLSEANLGEKNGLWKGDLVSYRSLHKWVERRLGKAIKCMKNPLHKSTRYHWSNISGKYLRNVSDWIQLCPSCNLTDGIKIPERLRVSI